MGSFELAENHRAAAPASRTIDNLWGKDSHNDFIAASKAQAGKYAIYDSEIACSDCNKKSLKPQDNSDSSVEAQLKLVAPENIEHDKHYGDTRVPKTIWLFLDTSGSMNEHIAGPDSPRKIAAITQAFQEYLPQIPPGVEVGLATLNSDSDKNPVFKILIEPSPNSSGEIVDAMKHILPDGGTPIAYGFEKMREHCYQANGTAKYTEPMWIIYGGDGGENFIKAGEKDACDEVHEWLSASPQGIAVRAIGIAIEKNNPDEVAKAERLFDCLNGSKSVSAHTVKDIVKELQATPGTLPATNPDIDTKVQGKLLEKNVNGKVQNRNGNASDANGTLLPANKSGDDQQVYGEMIKAQPNAKHTAAPDNVTPNNMTPDMVPGQSTPESAR